MDSGTDIEHEMTTEEVAKYLKVHVVTVHRWRGHNPPRGPAFYREGRRVKYDRVDVDLFKSGYSVLRRVETGNHI